jgi:hypothetical protein
MGGCIIIDMCARTKYFVEGVIFGVGVVIDLVIDGNGHVIRYEGGEVTGASFNLYAAHDGVRYGVIFFFAIFCKDNIKNFANFGGGTNF